MIFGHRKPEPLPEASRCRISKAMRPLLIGPLVTAVFALTVAYFFWTGTVREWDPNQVDLSKRDEQRHMAECYRVRCGHVGASPVLACACASWSWKRPRARRRSTSPRRRKPAVGSRRGSARSPRGPRMNSERWLSAVPRGITDR